MQEASRAFCLAASSHGENGILVRFFSEEWGLSRGFMRGGRKKKAELQPLNVLDVTRQRRLEDQLGTLTVELVANTAGKSLGAMTALQCVQYVSALLCEALPEEQHFPAFFKLTEAFIDDLLQQGLWQRLAFYELSLLTTLGYGLSLTLETGAVPCEQDTPLRYVSPKTGRAVSEVMGKPYAERLFVLPALFGGAENDDEKEDCLNCFRLTGYFLREALHGKKIDGRDALIDAFVQGFST